MSQSEPFTVQFWHAAPLPPQLLFATPGAHASAAVQHPAQFAGPHLSLHTRPWHFCPPALQSSHALPPDPHALSCVPTTHTLPLQQPLGQVPGPHAGAEQMPALHTWPPPTQFWQFFPPVPHAVSCVPIAQMFPTQHPGQFPGLHAPFGTHALPEHVSFGAHALQAAPPLPQAAFVSFVMQVLPTQHPAQLPGPHVTCGWQVRSFGWPFGTQMSPIAEQFLQAAPLFPHALLSPPPVHVVPLQQPPQFAGPHVGLP